MDVQDIINILDPDIYYCFGCKTYYSKSHFGKKLTHGMLCNSCYIFGYDVDKDTINRGILDEMLWV